MTDRELLPDFFFTGTYIMSSTQVQPKRESHMTVLGQDEIAAIKASHKDATNSTIIHDRIAAYHKVSLRVDVRQLHDKAWRVNVYESDDNLVPRITLPYSYYVRLADDGSISFDPPLHASRP